LSPGKQSARSGIALSQCTTSGAAWHRVRYGVGGLPCPAGQARQVRGGTGPAGCRQGRRSRSLHGHAALCGLTTDFRGRRCDGRGWLCSSSEIGRVWYRGGRTTADGRQLCSVESGGRVSVAEIVTAMPSLELWPVGNCQVSGLIDERGALVWGCVPRVDGDP